jgi:hypothetical protein
MIKRIRHTYLPYISNLLLHRINVVLYSIVYFFKLKKVKRQCSKENGAIVFLVDKPQTIIFRVVKWLKRHTKKEVILFSNSRKMYFSDSNDFDQVIYFRNKYDLILKLSKQIVFIIHAFAPPSEFMSFLIKKSNYKVIGDWKDISLNYHGFNPPYKYLKVDLPHEKYCLENCDGLIARSLEPKIAASRYQVKLKQKKLLFPEYCDNDDFVQITRKERKEEIHLVYAGNIHGFTSKDPLNISQVIKQIVDQEIYFHLYPSQRVSKNIVDEYKMLEKYSKYFIIHDSVKSEELPEEISQYDFGVQPFFTYDVEMSKYKRQGSFTMKIFNYLEAGLPIIIFKGPVVQNYFVSRYKVGFSIDKEGLNSLKSIIRNKDYQIFQKNIENVRLKYSYSRNIMQLTEFYHNL